MSQSATIARTIGNGVSLLSFSDFFVNVDLTNGAATIMLPKVDDVLNYLSNGSGTYVQNQSYRFKDINNLAAINNITIIAAIGDNISGAASQVFNTNGVSFSLQITSDNDWVVSGISTGSGGGGGSLDIFTTESINIGSPYTLTNIQAVYGGVGNYIILAAGSYIFDLNYEFYKGSGASGSTTGQIRTNTNTSLVNVDGTDRIQAQRTQATTAGTDSGIAFMDSVKFVSATSFIVKASFADPTSVNSGVNNMLLRAIKIA